MFGLWDKNNNQEYEFVDPSIFYFEASFTKEQVVMTNGKSDLISTIQTHPCVPCTKELFEMNNWP